MIKNKPFLESLQWCYRLKINYLIIKTFECEKNLKAIDTKNNKGDGLFLFNSKNDPTKYVKGKIRKTVFLKISENFSELRTLFNTFTWSPNQHPWRSISTLHHPPIAPQIRTYSQSLNCYGDDRRPATEIPSYSCANLSLDSLLLRLNCNRTHESTAFIYPKINENLDVSRNTFSPFGMES